MGGAEHKYLTAYNFFPSQKRADDWVSVCQDVARGPSVVLVEFPEGPQEDT